MDDVSIDDAALRSATARLVGAARTVLEAGRLAPVDPGAVASPEVVAPLTEVTGEQHERAAHIAHVLETSGRMPGRAVAVFGALDGAMARPS